MVHAEKKIDRNLASLKISLVSVIGLSVSTDNSIRSQNYSCFQGTDERLICPSQVTDIQVQPVT